MCRKKESSITQTLERLCTVKAKLKYFTIPGFNLDSIIFYLKYIQRITILNESSVIKVSLTNPVKTSMARGVYFILPEIQGCRHSITINGSH